MNGIPKGLCSFGGVQRQRLWWGVGQSLAIIKRSARGESKNNPVNCFSRGDALQVRASPYRADNIRPYSVSFIILLLGTGRRGRRPLQIMIHSLQYLRSRLRNCAAVATCCFCMTSEPSISAIVRATFSILS